ncbi:hypothetical protein KPH14_008285 [Odynerus spinipes]|uniref:Uncharacterized protein n=1 Tax=Odynerus spinipes TaxID=1348599 RepID=A0AAD9VLU1_9HYME|nr:hypothetical protein KPH14_008285 [Odynerus spinipes]
MAVNLRLEGCPRRPNLVGVLLLFVLYATLTIPCVFANDATTTMVQKSKECFGVRKQSKGEVKLAVIAPGDPHHEQSLPRVLPAVLLAVRAVSSAKGPLPGWNIKVDHRDSRCSSTYGPLAAFEFYINQTAGRFDRPLFSLSLTSHLSRLFAVELWLCVGIGDPD